MTAPRTGPLIRAHAIGGPAWSSVVGVIPGTTSMAGRTSIRTGCEAARRRSASRFAASTSSRQSVARVSAPGGRQSTRLTSTPRAVSASAKRSTPVFTTLSSAPNNPPSAATAASREIASELGGQAVRRADVDARAPERLLLLGESLRILVGADHVRDDLDRPAPTPGARPGLADGGGERAGRVRMGAVAEDHVDQDDADGPGAAGARDSR